MPHVTPPWIWLRAVFALRTRADAVRRDDARHANDPEVGIDVHFGEHRAERVHRVLLLLGARLRRDR